MPVAQESSSTRRSTFALVIAIDKYRKNSIPPLSGCINDAEDFQMFLTETLHVHPENIHTLFDNAATRDNILKEFDEHLIYNQKIQKDDLIFFYYAGHGDRVDAPGGWSAPKGMVEVICPVDVTAFEDESSTTQGVTRESVPVVYGIPDRTFHALMRHVAEVKGNNIVAVFDCCHSGGISRDLGSDAGVRALPDGSVLSKRLRLPEDLDEKIVNRAPDELQGRNIALKAPDGFSYSGATSHVLLAACQPKEKAREYQTNGRTTRGRFTDNLLGYLRDTVKANSGLQLLRISYADLMKIVAERLKDHIPARDPPCQRPHCEGYHSNRFLFSTEEARTSDTFSLVYGPEENSENAPCVLYMNIGAIHGVVKGETGTRLSAVYSHPASDIPSTRIELYPSRVEPLRSELAIEGISGDRTEEVAKLLNRARATVSVWNVKAMKVRTTQDVPVGNGSFKVVRTKSPGEYADISYVPSVDGGEGCLLTRYDPLITRFARQTLLVERINSRVLDDIARFNFHLYHYTSAARIREELSIKVRLNRLKRPKDGGLGPKLIPADESEDLFTTEGTQVPTLSADPQSAYQLCEDGVKEAIIMDLRPYYGLTLINESKVDIFPYVFYFDPGDYSIAAWYLPQNEQPDAAPLRKQDVPLGIGHGVNADDAIQFSLPPNVNEESGFLKVFASTSYVDMKTLEQPSPWDMNRGSQMKRVPSNPGWSSSTYVLTVRSS
ncbi:hypothetical protein DAEQUDRAFT_737307 [Daedalea quercina L-15889]|uniref:Peptidase C14 caspase domain-containing protein n=1 Tax=Daedalea quercina L-15889 TaxID=1314783 RepID=A0A165RES4_9APHY|nr:hypothetical protein DAEQUDRAFT_737307 [Daedalea quercina L-15889]